MEEKDCDGAMNSRRTRRHVLGAVISPARIGNLRTVDWQ